MQLNADLNLQKLMMGVVCLDVEHYQNQTPGAG